MKERREGDRWGGGDLSSREKNASIHKQGMQFVQSTTQIEQFSSGSKAFFSFSFFLNTFLFFPAIPLELEHNTKYTVIELCKITHRGLWEAFESTLTILNYSTLKLFLNVIINRADNVCMHILNAYEVTMLKHLHLLKVWHHLQWKLNKLSWHRFDTVTWREEKPNKPAKVEKF